MSSYERRDDFAAIAHSALPQRRGRLPDAHPSAGAGGQPHHVSDEWRSCISGRSSSRHLGRAVPPTPTPVHDLADVGSTGSRPRRRGQPRTDPTHWGPALAGKPVGGCRFHTRCPFRQRPAATTSDQRCGRSGPGTQPPASHYAEEILSGQITPQEPEAALRAGRGPFNVTFWQRVGTNRTITVQSAFAVRCALGSSLRGILCS